MPQSQTKLPTKDLSPFVYILRRAGFALLLITFVTAVAYLDRHSYRDSAGGPVGFIDSLYYSTVSITTTGYGDITPVTEGSRLRTALLITPARILFLILLVGTTVEVLASQTRNAYRVQRRKQKLKDHIIICGFGVKGQSAAETLINKGSNPEQIVIIDSTDSAIEAANRLGYMAIKGNASRSEVLHEAGIEKAKSVLITPDRDDSSVLITLTAREHNTKAIISTTVREEENVHLVRQSGADAVIVSSASAGRMIALSCDTPQMMTVMEDMLSVGKGIDLAEREIFPQEVGPLARLQAQVPVVAVIRNEEILRFDDPDAIELQEEDHIIYLYPHSKKKD